MKEVRSEEERADSLERALVNFNYKFEFWILIVNESESTAETYLSLLEEACCEFELPKPGVGLRSKQTQWQKL